MYQAPGMLLEMYQVYDTHGICICFEAEFKTNTCIRYMIHYVSDSSEKIIWIGRAGPARPYALWNFFEKTFFIFYFRQKLRLGLAHRHWPPSSSSWLPKGALAPHLARPIRVPRHSYSSIPPTRVTVERNDRWLMHIWPVGNAMAIAMRDMEKIDRKILVAASFPSWRQSAPRACLGRSCAPNTATKALIVDYVSHYHAYEGYVTWQCDWKRSWGYNCDRPGQCALDELNTLIRGWHTS